MEPTSGTSTGVTYDLKGALEQIAQKFNYKLDRLNEEQWRLDVPMKLKDGSYRYQFVYLWISKGYAKGKDVIYMNSRAGIYSAQINLYNILKEAGYGVYSAITITNDKKADGTPCETIIVQASPIAEYTNLDTLSYIIFEVASVADILEEKYFGGDNN
jgi:hypothetical protein